MANIKIHGQKMQFHKKVAISVTLTSGTGGTATFEPVPSVDYTLSSLPVGAQIVKSSGDYLIKHNNVTIGAVEASPASGYAFKDMVLWKNSGAIITISTTPITLDDSDVIVVSFVSTMKEIQFYLGWDNQSYGDPWSYTRLTYNGQSLNPNVPYIETQNNRDKVQLEISSKGLDGSFKFYVNGGSSSDGLIAEIIDSTYKISRIEYYNPDTGTTYTCDGTSTVIGNVGSMGTASILLDTAQSCEVVELQSMLINPNEFTQTIEYALQSKYSFIRQIQQWTSPQSGYMYYTFYDGFLFHMICKANIMLMTQSGMMINGAVIVAFSTDNRSTSYLTMYDYDGQIYQGYPDIPRRNDTGYPYYGENPWNDVYSNNSQQGLQQLMLMWNCQDVCDLITKISNLAKGYY